MTRVLSYIAGSLGALVLLLGFAFYYFVHAPLPEAPPLSGKLKQDTMAFGGRQRTYLAYVPADLKPGAPLVVSMHGSGGDGAGMRSQSGYEFDRLADRHGFVVAYPDGVEGYWNGCNRVGDYAANALNIDDVGFLVTLAEKLSAQFALDPGRVFATGMSRGGAMALRLAVEAPDRVRAIASMGASVPVESNDKCAAAGGGVSVMIVNGVGDPLNPFDGGEVALYGLLMKRGEVRSASASAQFFADLNQIATPPETATDALAGGVRVARTAWSDGGGAEVELIAIDGAGHVIPQPHYRHPRLLGPTPREPNGPELIWQFFDRQKARP